MVPFLSDFPKSDMDLVEHALLTKVEYRDDECMRASREVQSAKRKPILLSGPPNTSSSALVVPLIRTVIKIIVKLYIDFFTFCTCKGIHSFVTPILL